MRSSSGTEDRGWACLSLSVSICVISGLECTDATQGTERRTRNAENASGRRTRLGLEPDADPSLPLASSVGPDKTSS